MLKGLKHFASLNSHYAHGFRETCNISQVRDLLISMMLSKNIFGFLENVHGRHGRYIL